MPNLGPRTKNKVGLRDDWYIPVSNPVDPEDDGLCVQITRGPFSHVVIKYNNFRMIDEENSDGLRKAAQNNEALDEAGIYSDPNRCCMSFEQIGG